MKFYLEKSVLISFLLATIVLSSLSIFAYFRTQQLIDAAQSVPQLQPLNKELETFSFSVSHDLRTPLRNVGPDIMAIINGSFT